jgi:hypothetical protein
MRLFNKTIDRQLFKQYSLGSDLAKQEVVAKIFNPYGNGTWFILNSDPQDPDYLWAIVDLGYGAEVGSVSRTDLETYRGRFGMGFERDLSFDPVNALELYNGLSEGKNYADGGNIEDFTDNQQMIMNQNVELEHHHEELEDILKDEMPVPAWVVAKMATATQSVSDVTHYLDGEKELMEDENQIRSSEFFPVDEDEEDDEDQEAIKNQNVVEPINVSAGTKAELTKKFTDDAMGNLRGFLKGMEGVDLRDDYTFDYKDEQYEVEPIINSDENGVSNAVFSIFDGDGEEVGDVSYSRDGGKQKFTANSEFFSWNNAKFEDGGFMNNVYADGGYFDGTIPKVSTYMSNYADGGGIEWDKDSDSIRAEMGEFKIMITPQTQRGYYDVNVKASNKTIGNEYDVYGIDNAKNKAYEIISESNKFAKGGSLGNVNPKYKNSILSIINYKIDKRVGDSMSDISYTEALNLKNKINKDEPISSQEKKYISEMASYLSSKRLLDKVANISYTESFDFFDNIVSMANGGEVAKAEIIRLTKNILGTTSIEMKISGMRKTQDFSVYPIGKDDTDKIITIQSETRIGKIDLATGRGLMSQSHSNGAYFVHFQMDKLTPFTINEKDLKDITSHIYRTAGDNVGSRGIFSDNSGASGVYADGGFMADVYADGGLINAKTFDFLKKHKGFRYTIEEKPNGRIALQIQEDGSKSYAEIYNSTDDKNVFYINSVSGNIGDEIEIGKRWYGDTPYNLNGVKLWLKERGYIKEKINVIKNYPTTYNEYISLLTDYEPLQQFAEFIGYTYPNYYFDNDNRIYTNYMLPQYKYFNVKGYLEPLFWNNFFQKLFKTKDLRLTLTLFGTQIGTKDTGNYGSKQGFINSGEKYLLDIFYMNEISPLLDIKNWHRINEKNLEIDSKFIKKIEIRSKNNFKMILDYIVSELKNNKEFQNYLKTKDSESVKGKGLKSGDSIVESFDKYVKVKTKENETVYVVLTTGERTFNLPTKFADGGFMADVYKRGGETPKLSELKREDWKHKYGGSTVNFYQTYGDKEFHTQVYKLGDGYEATPGLNNLGLSGFYTKRFENRNEAIKFAKDSIKEQIEEYKAYYTTPKNIKDYVGKHFIYGHTVYYIGGLRKNTVKQGGYSERKGRMVDTSGQYKPSFIVLEIEIDHKLSPYDPNQKVIKGSNLQIIDLDSFKSKKYYNISSKKLPSKIQEKIDSKKEYFERFEGEKLEDGGFMNNVYADGGNVEKPLTRFRVGESFRYKNNGSIIYTVTKVYNDGACEARDEEGDNYSFEFDELNELVKAENNYADGGAMKKEMFVLVKPFSKGADDFYFSYAEKKPNGYVDFPFRGFEKSKPALFTREEAEKALDFKNRTERGIPAIILPFGKKAQVSDFINLKPKNNDNEYSPFSSNDDAEADITSYTDYYADGGFMDNDLKELWYVSDKDDKIKNISTSKEKAQEFLSKIGNIGNINYVKVPISDWNSEKVSVSNIKNYAERYWKSYAKGGMVVTSVKDIPNFTERLEQRKITYRGLGMGKLYDTFYDLAGTSGTRIKVDGKEYFITDEEFNTFSRGADGKMQIRFDAPARKGYADGGSVKSETKVGETYIRKDMRGNWKAETNIDNFNDYDWRLSTIKTYSGKLITSAQGGKTEPTGSKGYEIFKYTPYEDPNYTLEVSSPKRLTDKVVSEQHVKGLAKFKKFMETGMFRGGGKISKFDKLSDKVAKEYEGKPVKSQFQEEYGKYYSKAEAQEVGDKVAGKVKAMQMTKK